MADFSANQNAAKFEFSIQALVLIYCILNVFNCRGGDFLLDTIGRGGGVEIVK